jgi:hypothetical protein
MATRKNPWNKRAPAATARPSTSQKSKGSSTRPKSLSELRKAKTSRSRLPASVTLPSWLRVGSSVKLTWRYDPAYGTGYASFVGKVTKLDDWITVVNSADVICHMPVRSATVERVSAR